MTKLGKVTKHLTTVELTTMEDGLILGVRIRKIDPSASSLKLIEKLSAKDAGMLVSLRNAEIGGKLAADLDKTPERGTAIPDATTEMAAQMQEKGQEKEAEELLSLKNLSEGIEAIGAIREIPLELLRDAFVSLATSPDVEPRTWTIVPATVEDMIGVYEGSTDLPDLGMGEDFDKLMTAIETHSGTVTPTLRNIVEQERFPEKVG